jgi:hypothetical protein
MSNDSLVQVDVIDAEFEPAGPNLGIRIAKGFFRWLCYIFCAGSLALLVAIAADIAGKGKLGSAIAFGLIFSIMPGCFAVLAWILRPHKRRSVSYVTPSMTAQRSVPSQTVAASEVTEETSFDERNRQLKSKRSPIWHWLWLVMKWMVAFPIVILMKIAWAVVKIPLANFVGSMLGGGEMHDAADRLFGVGSTQPQWSNQKVASISTPTQSSRMSGTARDTSLDDDPDYINPALVVRAVRIFAGSTAYPTTTQVYSNARFIGYVNASGTIYNSRNVQVGRVGRFQNHLALYNRQNRMVEYLD